MEHNVAAAIKVYGYELGNEPSCYMAKVGITGAQSAADFGRVTSLLHNVYGQQQQQQQQQAAAAAKGEHAIGDWTTGPRHC